MVRALEDDGAPRSDRATRLLQPVRMAGAFDDEVGPPLGQGRAGHDPVASEPRPRVGVASRDTQLAPGEGQRARDELPQAAGAHHAHALAGSDRPLLLDLERGGGGLREHRDLVGEARRDLVQVREREGEELGQGPLAAADPDDRAFGTMGAPAGRAIRAPAAGDVDLADHAAGDPFLGAGGLLHHAHELVAGDARAGRVAAPQLQVGSADAGQDHAHDRLAGLGPRGGQVLKIA